MITFVRAPGWSDRFYAYRKNTNNHIGMVWKDFRGWHARCAGCCAALAHRTAGVTTRRAASDILANHYTAQHSTQEKKV